MVEYMRIKIVCCFIFFVVVSPLVMGQGGQKEERRLMDNIVRNCVNNIPVVVFPRPDLRVDQDLQSFSDSKRWLKRDLKDLRRINPDAEKSSFFIRGKAFSSHLKLCQKKLDTIQAELNEFISKKPSKIALAKLDNALWSCNVATRWLEEPEKLGDPRRNIAMHYDRYLVGIERALKLDSKINSWKEAEIKACNEMIVPRSLALKNKQKTKIALKNQRKINEEALKLAQAKESHDAKTRKSQSLGYKGFYGGITSLLDELGHGQTTIEDFRPYLFLPDSGDRFYVDSIVGESVIYGFKRNSSEYIRIAVKKESGKYYGDGAALADVYYSVVGIEEFVTVLGHTKQVVIFSAVSNN